jgi:hypothetical protein
VAASPRPSAAGIVRAAAALYRRHFGVLFLTAAALGVPPALVDVAVPAVPETGREIALVLLSATVEVLASVVAIVQVDVARRGGAPTLFGAVTAGTRRLLPALGALAMSTVWVCAAGAAGAIVLGGAWVFSPHDLDPLVRLLGLVLGLVLLAVPVTLVLLRFFVVVPVAVLEPGMPALQRSGELARGAYRQIGVLALIGWLAWVPATVLPWVDAGPPERRPPRIRIASWSTSAR